MEKSPYESLRLSRKEKFQAILEGLAGIGGGMAQIGEGMSRMSLTGAHVPIPEQQDYQSVGLDIKQAMQDIDDTALRVMNERKTEE